MALVGSAAAVVAVGAAALAWTFSGSPAPRGQSANPSAVRLSTRPGASPTGTQQHVLGNATREPTPSATQKASAASGASPGHGASQTPADLCRQFFGYVIHHSRGDRAKEDELLKELSRLAGSPMNIGGYCAQQLHPVYAATPWPTSSFPFPGSWGGDGRPNSGTWGSYPGSGGSR